MDPLQTLLSAPSGGGVFHLEHDAREIELAALAAGLAAWRINIGHVHDRDDFLRAVAAALKFPDWFGGNWDALADCLRDLSWLPAAGWLLVFERSKHFASGHRHEFDLAMEVLGEASEYWRARGKSFWVLVGGAQGWDSGLPRMKPA